MQHCAAEDVSLINMIVSILKITWAIDTFKLFKWPGPDGIVLPMLQHASAILVPILGVIYKAC